MLTPEIVGRRVKELELFSNPARPDIAQFVGNHQTNEKPDRESNPNCKRLEHSIRTFARIAIHEHQGRRHRNDNREQTKNDQPLHRNIV
jgi:hypothetical protein